MHIIGYGTEFGDEKLYSQLEKDLSDYIKMDDFSFYDFQLIIGIFWFYALYRFDENKLKTDWNIPQDLVEQIKNKYDLFVSKNIDLSNINRVLNNLKERFNLVHW